MTFERFEREARRRGGQNAFRGTVRPLPRCDHSHAVFGKADVNGNRSRVIR
jgi:hypothetical protein